MLFIVWSRVVSRLNDPAGIRTATSNAVDVATKNGWRTDLPTSGERVNVDPKLQLADHAREARYKMTPPPAQAAAKINPRALYIHPPQGRKGRASIDDASERFIEETRMGIASPEA